MRQRDADDSRLCGRSRRENGSGAHEDECKCADELSRAAPEGIHQHGRENK
jgi:hypothetical protein